MSDENLKPLECFKAYLASGYAPDWAMQPADLHGLLLGLAFALPAPAQTVSPAEPAPGRLVDPSVQPSRSNQTI